LVVVEPLELLVLLRVGIEVRGHEVIAAVLRVLALLEVVWSVRLAGLAFVAVKTGLLSCA